MRLNVKFEQSAQKIPIGFSANESEFGIAFGESVVVNKARFYEKIVFVGNSEWMEYRGKWLLRIPQDEHNIKKIQGIVAERIVEEGACENMVYSYKHYPSGTLAIIVDHKIDMRVVIKGE